MEEQISKELEAIKKMVQTWKESYLREAPDNGKAEYLVEDLSQEIQTFVHPYVRRFLELGYLSEFEAREFLDQCDGEVEGLRKIVG